MHKLRYLATLPELITFILWKKARYLERIDGLLDSIRSIIIDARKNVAKNINTELLSTYWKIGKLIVEVRSNSKFDQKSSDN